MGELRREVEEEPEGEKKLAKGSGRRAAVVGKGGGLPLLGGRRCLAQDTDAKGGEVVVRVWVGRAS
jgi:hypothetical protein